MKDLVARKSGNSFLSVTQDQTVKDTLHLMKENDISQMPVMANGYVAGSITESNLLSHLLSHPESYDEEPVGKIMGKVFPTVSLDTPIKELQKYITRETPAVLVKDEAGELQVITQYDIIQAI